MLRRCLDEEEIEEIKKETTNKLFCEMTKHCNKTENEGGRLLIEYFKKRLTPLSGWGRKYENNQDI